MCRMGLKLERKGQKDINWRCSRDFQRGIQNFWCLFSEQVKVNNRKARKRCEICLKLTVNTFNTLIKYFYCSL